MAADAGQLCRQYEGSVTRQANFRQTWQDLAEFLTPYKANITTEHAPGQRRTQRMFDSTAVIAASTLSANIQGSVCNPAQEWFSIRVRDDALNDAKAVRDWCEVVSQRTLAAIAASNFYTEVSEVLVDLPVFAIGGLYCDEAQPKGPNRFGGLHYAALVIGHYAIEENADGRVDTVFRTFTWPKREVFAKWPDTCSEGVKNGAQDPVKADEPVKILHAVYPRAVSSAGARTGRNKPVASCYVELESKHLLGEGGYDEHPYAVARWSKDSQSPYGWGPGSIAYPDVRTLNRYVQLDLQARGKAVDPPLIQRQDGILGSLSLEPAAINVSLHDGPLVDSVMALESKARFDVNKDGIERLERKISECFYGPLLRQITKDMTATEAWIIQDETLRLLGPAAGRMQTELLGAAIERSIAILFRARQLPAPPDALVQAGFDADLDIVYEGPLARAQKSRDLVAIERKNAWLAQVYEINPAVADKFDWDAEAAHIAEVTGYPSDLVLSDEVVAARRQQRAEQQAAAAQLQILGGAAEAAGKVAPLAKVIQDGQQQPQGATAA